MRHETDFVPVRIMAALAHKDDESVAAGTLSKLAKQGHHVFLVAATQGELGSRVRSTRRIIAARQREFEEAAQLIGAYPISLGFQEGKFDKQSVQRELTGVARDIKADVVITHYHDDYHPLHREVSEAAKWAAYYTPATPYFTKTHRLIRSDSESMDGLKRSKFRRDVPALQAQDIAVYEMDPQGLKKRDSRHEGYDMDNIVQPGLIVALAPDEAKLRGVVYDTYHSQEVLRVTARTPYAQQLDFEAQLRGQQAGFDYGEGFTQVSWGGETFMTFNRLLDMLPGEVYDVKTRKLAEQY